MTSIVPRAKTAKQRVRAQAATKKRPKIGRDLRREAEAAAGRILERARWNVGADDCGPETLAECTTLIQQIRVLAIEAHGVSWWLTVRGPGASEKLAANAFFDGTDRRSHRSRIVLRCMELARSTGEISRDEPAIAP